MNHTPGGSRWRRRGRPAARVFAIAAVSWLAIGGCASPGTLEGSLSEVFDLRFDAIEVEHDGEELVIRYLRDVEYPDVAYYGRNTVTELRLTIGQEAWLLGEPIDVTYLLELNRFVMMMNESEQIVQDDRRFPDPYAAEVTLDELGFAPGEPVSGAFRNIFADGTTLRGTFSADLAAAGQ